MYKKTLLTFFLASSFCLNSCNTQGWEANDEARFVSNCISSNRENMTQETAETFCNCALEYAKSNYGSAKEAQEQMGDKDMLEIQKKCLRSFK
jgi:hypothetical protein